MSTQGAYRTTRSRLSGDLGSLRYPFPRRNGIARDQIIRISSCIIALEFAVTASTAYFASVAYNEIFLRRSPPSDQYVTAALFIATLILLVSLSFRQFTALASQTHRRFVGGGLAAVGIAFFLFLSAMFVFKVTGTYSRGTFIIQLFSVALADSALRAGALSWIRSAIAHGILEASRVVIIGSDSGYQSVLAGLAHQGVKVARVFDFPKSLPSTENGSGNLDLDFIRRIVSESRSIGPDDILILADHNDLKISGDLAYLLSELPASIHLLPGGDLRFLRAARPGELGTQPTLQVVSRPLSTFDRLVKRTFDIAAAATGLVVLAPLLLLASIAIKLDSRGPIFFRQIRHGFNNEPIRVLKFRSMTVAENGNAFRQARKVDPRVTRVGRILRRTNIDELPQLINVLSGEMSIVGPRPHPVALNEQYEALIAPLMRRHKIKPGITGWAQINGCRGETSTVEKMQERLKYDLYYIDNWSFLFDMQIILLTLFSSKAYTNAY
jgi:Undecaprenyl-phosphate glucose phosphotransferase